MNGTSLPAILLLVAVTGLLLPAQAPAKPKSLAGQPAGKNTPPKPVLAKWEPRTYVNSFGMEFMEIPAGSFMQGSQSDPRNMGEKPRRKVEITRPFFMGRCEVTQEQWVLLYEKNPSSVKGRNLPVSDVSWDHVQAFIRGLNSKELVGYYRLPTEAEWEWAARAGTDAPYPFGAGTTMLNEYAWTLLNSGEAAHPVATRRANPWGLFDMQGNLAEWCQDWYAKDAYATGPVKDPLGPASGLGKVVRGGSYAKATPVEETTVYARGMVAPHKRASNVGFRLVWEPPPPETLTALLDPALVRLPWEKRAEAGEAVAQYQMYLKCLLGKGVVADTAKAFLWLSLAAHQGVTEAQVQLGEKYRLGSGVSKNPAQAVAWFTKAAERGHPRGQYELGQALEEGFGTPRDLLKAVQWWQRSAEQGFGPAYSKLATAFRDGAGVTRDAAKADELFRRVEAIRNNN